MCNAPLVTIVRLTGVQVTTQSVREVHEQFVWPTRYYYNVQTHHHYTRNQAPINYAPRLAETVAICGSTPHKYHPENMLVTVSCQTSAYTRRQVITTFSGLSS